MVLDDVSASDIVSSQKGGLVNESLWPYAGDAESEVEVIETLSVTQGEDLFPRGVGNFNDLDSGIVHRRRMVMLHSP